MVVLWSCQPKPFFPISKFWSVSQVSKGLTKGWLVVKGAKRKIGYKCSKCLPHKISALKLRQFIKRVASTIQQQERSLCNPLLSLSGS